MAKSRWCRVIAKRFDHMIGPTTMLSADRGEIRYLPEEILEAGEARGELERIPRPPHLKVDKTGRVVPCS